MTAQLPATIRQAKHRMAQAGLAAERDVVAQVHGPGADQGRHLPRPVADEVRGHRGGRALVER